MTTAAKRECLLGDDLWTSCRFYWGEGSDIQTYTYTYIYIYIYVANRLIGLVIIGKLSESLLRNIFPSW